MTHRTIIKTRETNKGLKYKTIKSEKKPWTPEIFYARYKNHPPMTYGKSVEIIHAMHEAMMENIYNGRPVLIDKKIGTIFLYKMFVPMHEKLKIIDHTGKARYILNHESEGHVFWITHVTSKMSIRSRVMRFSVLVRHKNKLFELVKKRIIRP